MTGYNEGGRHRRGSNDPRSAVQRVPEPRQSATVRTLPRPDSEGPQAGPFVRLLAAKAWPLTLILVVQAALSMRLIWSNTAFIDEAEYILAGHMELAHLTQHTAFATYFSGAPVIYPPIAAYFDSLGGLAAARLLSLAFMLVATTLLHGVARRLLSDRVAATLAAALFAWLGSAQFLGAFATYDAMALTLLAAATWLGVLAAEKSGWVSYALLVGAGFAMALADATKYAAALFDPVVIAVIGLAVWRKRGPLIGSAIAVLATAVTASAAYRCI